MGVRESCPGYGGAPGGLSPRCMWKKSTGNKRHALYRVDEQDTEIRYMSNRSRRARSFPRPLRYVFSHTLDLKILRKPAAEIISSQLHFRGMTIATESANDWFHTLDIPIEVDAKDELNWRINIESSSLDIEMFRLRTSEVDPGWGTCRVDWRVIIEKGYRWRVCNGAALSGLGLGFSGRAVHVPSPARALLLSGGAEWNILRVWPRSQPNRAIDDQWLIITNPILTSLY